VFSNHFHFKSMPSAGNPADPLIGLPGLISSLARTASSPTNNLAGFSTTGVPGFAPPDAGTFATYRRISAHPTVALVMKMVTAPIVANTWGWMSKPGCAAGAGGFCEKHDRADANLYLD
jgi:hypothetical protein